MRVVIIGAGPAGLTAAEAIRTRSPETTVEMISAEPFPPYAPPAMADHFLTGRDVTLYWKGEDVCERLGIEYRSGVAVARVVPSARRVELEDGTALGYDRLVLASGGRLYAPVVGADLPGIANFKSLRAAKALVSRAKQGQAKSAVIVGAGFVGVEVALVLRDLGLSVTLVEALDRVMPRMLDAETAEIVEKEIRRRGISLRLGTRVSAFAGKKRAELVLLESGEELAADIYVAATGVKPNIEPIADSGIGVRWGVVVDDRLRTSAADVFAAGDVANAFHPVLGRHIRVEHWANALNQPAVAAAGMLGNEAVYDRLPYFYTDQFDLGMEYVGYADGGAEVVVRGSGLEFIAFWLREGRVAAGMNVNVWDVVEPIRELILSGREVDPSRLADPEVSLDEV